MKAAVIGATGYTGVELVKIILKHEHLELSAITSESYAGNKFSEIYPAMYGMCDMVLEENNIETISQKADVFFLCLPHKAAMETASILYKKGKIVIDLSADFRIKDKSIYEATYNTEHTAADLLEKAVYGQAEIFTEQIKKTSLIAGAGCYPTSIITPLYPLLENNIIDDNQFIIADSKSGVSGAGRKPTLTNIFCEANEDLKPYGIFSHRHNAEIDHILSQAKNNTHVIFTPHLLPVNRGILSTIYIKTNKDKKEIENAIKSKYRGRFFVRVREDIPAIRYVTHTNFIDIAVFKKDDTAIIVTAIDNLLKGASAQAVQCYNIMQNIDEKTGLI